MDVETANSDTSSICQIGLALVSDQSLVQTVSFLIDPQTHFDEFNVNLHGINPAAVSGQPDFSQVIQSLRAFLERHPLVQHSSFDKRAIEGACRRYGLPNPKCHWHDSVTIARQAWPELKGNGGHGLASLKTHLDLDFDHHDAAEDAKAAAQVVLLAEQKTGEYYEELAKGHKRAKNKANYTKSVTLEGNQNGPLFGHVACFTGQMTMTRTEAATRAAGAGITVKSSVSKKVTLLVVGDQDLTLLNGHEKSTKHRRADELIATGQEIRILGETEFMALIEG
ncbi:exonuclease [Leisingera sp. ANG-DT]|nr:exonuclease [Leisingera sp. ANG-DT]